MNPEETHFPSDWTEPCRKIFLMRYETHGPKWLSEKFKTMGVIRTPLAIRSQARRNTKLIFNPTNGHNIREAAGMLGVGYTTLYRTLHTHYKDRLKKYANLYIVTPELLKELEEIYPPIPEGYISRKEACERLDLTPSMVTRHLRNGNLRGILHGTRWYIDGKDVDYVVNWLKKNPHRVSFKWARWKKEK